MLTLALIYLAGGLGTLAVLCLMILRIGAMMGDCPSGGPAARPAAITVATGFAAIGAGGVLLIGAVLPMFAQHHIVALMLALGLAALCLGLGFTQAVTTLRAVLAPVRESAPVAGSASA